MIGAILFFTTAFEYAHYTKLLMRHNYFNDLRVEQTNSDEEQWKMVKAILRKNPDLFERASRIKHTSHIVDEDALYKALTVEDEIKPANQVCVGCGEIYWRYHPHRLESFMICIRKLGELYMYFAGFKRTWHLTDDGYYSVYKYEVNKEERPIIFFPGFGMGAIPYAHIAKQFNRTVYIIEVPNIGYATPLSERQATGESLYEAVNNCIIKGEDFDIFAHSLGSAHASHFINKVFQKNQLCRVKNAVICDGFVNPIDVINSHLYPFVDYCDYNILHKKTRNIWEFNLFVYFALHNPEFGSWAKRFHNLYDGVLWRDYMGVNINYVYCEKDFLYDTEYICKNSKCLFVKKASHGACLFGKKNKDTIRQILIWLNAE
jgi:hypothetical protein